MGYDSRSMAYTCALSRHNSPRDEEHNKLWNDFLDRVKAIADEPQYREIGLLGDGWRADE